MNNTRCAQIYKWSNIDTTFSTHQVFHYYEDEQRSNSIDTTLVY